MSDFTKTARKIVSDSGNGVGRPRLIDVVAFADALLDDIELGTAGKIDVNEARRALERLMGWEEGTLTSARDNGHDGT